MKLAIEHKFSLTVYAWGLITGIISGALATKFEGGWIVGLLMYVFIDKFVMAVVKELPPDVPDERAILKKGFWGWALFWLYFTMLSYSLLTNFQPVCYSNQSLLCKMMQSGNTSVNRVVNFTG
ncbi:MAG: hypothetical protein J7L37_01345 [Thermococcus sp.]|nr:hypothetical protein [Thermococcus sp.]